MKTLAALFVAANLAFVATVAVASPDVAGAPTAEAAPAWEVIDFEPMLVQPDVVVDRVDDRTRYTFSADTITVDGAATIAAVTP